MICRFPAFRRNRLLRARLSGHFSHARSKWLLAGGSEPNELFTRAVAALRGVFVGHDDSLTENFEGGLQFFGSGVVVGVEHAADDGLSNVEAAG